MARARVLIIGLTLVGLLVAGMGLRPATGVLDRLDPVLRRLATASPRQLVRIIVQRRGEGAAEAGVLRLGGRLLAPLPIIGGFTAELPAAGVLRLATDPDVGYISWDRPLQVSSSQMNVNTGNLATVYPEASNVTQVWNEGPGRYTGAGIGVAVLDTGIAAAPDFGNRLLVQAKINPHATSATDTYGHGTLVAGILGGNAPSGRYIGIAPGANLLSVKISDDSGRTSEGAAIIGTQWVLDNKEKYNIRVVNLSLSAATQSSYRTDPLDAAVERLWRSGIVVVVAAGNRGGQACAVCYAPANDPYVISVGAVDDHGTRTNADDTVTAWSSYGTTQDGFAKPDLVAPGAHLVSVLASPSDNLATSYPQNIVDGSYMRMGGTSMSSPVVAGVVALMLQANPALKPDQVKWILANTARSYRNQPAGTAGIVNGAAAVNYGTGDDHGVKSDDHSAGSDDHGMKSDDHRVPGSANQGLTPSGALNTATGQITFNNVYWDNVYWDNVYWDNVYWDNVYWDNVYWENVYWENDPSL